MKKLLTFVIMQILFVIIIFPDDFREAVDSIIITREMVSPTENSNAMEAYNTGNSLMRQNKFKEAEEYYILAIDLDENYVDAMDQLGIVYRHLEKYQESEYWYLKSISINSNNIVPYINLALVYRLQGRYEDARQTYLKAQKIDQDDPEPYFGIGMLYQIVGQYDLSIDFMSIAIQKYKEKNSMLICSAFYAQGNNYNYKEELDEALKYYKLALLGYPDNEEINIKIKEIESMLK